MTRTPPSPRAEPGVVSGWTVLSIDELRLALPQRDLLQFELAADLRAPGADLAPAAGRFVTGSEESWPVYRLDESLQLRPTRSGARGLCVFFEDEGRTRGLLCDRVWALDEDAALVVEPVPGCLRGPPSPATGLAQFQGRIAVVTGRAAISAYLAHLLEQADVEHG